MPTLRAPALPVALISETTARKSRATLKRAADRGELLRLRPGVFIRALDWASSPPWIRHRAVTAALSVQHPHTVFCQETASAIYGLPLLRVPRQLQLRTLSPAQAGRVRTGRARLTGAEPWGPHTWSLRRRLPPVPLHTSAAAARALYQEAGLQPCVVEVAGVVLDDGSPVYARVEPLPFVLLDTVPRFDAQSAVVMLDAALAGRYAAGGPVTLSHLHAVEPWLWSRQAVRAWTWAVDFADPLSESPGESRSRVLIEELGFERPHLQTEVRLTGGRRARLDFDWPQHDVFGEFDGRVKYDDAPRMAGTDDASVYWSEKRREEEVELVTGKRVVRWTWDDLERPKQLERKLLLKGVPKR